MPFTYLALWLEEVIKQVRKLLSESKYEMIRAGIKAMKRLVKKEEPKEIRD